MPFNLFRSRPREEPLPKWLRNRRVAVRYVCGPGTSGQVIGGARGGLLRAKIGGISVLGLSLLLNAPLPAGASLLIQLRHKSRDICCDLAAQVIHSTLRPADVWVVGCAFERALSAKELAALVQS